MAKVLKGGEDLSITEIEPLNPKKGFTLEECYKHIGCKMVEVIDLRDGRILICDEESLLKSNPIINETATALASLAYNRWSLVFGSCILCKDDEFK